MTSTLTDLCRRRRDDSAAAATRLVDTAEREVRGLTVVERAEHDALLEDVGALTSRLAELEAEQAREARSEQVRADLGSGATGLQRGYVSDAPTYTPGAQSASFFRDLVFAQRGDFGAIERLQRNNAEVGLTRALGNTGGVGGSGGEFAPPGWLVDSFVKLARPGRVTADLFHREALPAGVSSVNLPRASTGTSTAVQTTQNTLLASVDMTTNALSAGIVTIGGKQVVSQQLLDQSAVPFDQVVLADLAADYARSLGTQALTGTGAAGQLRGYLAGASTNVVTWTQATPTASGFYAQLAKLQGAINASRYAAPDAVVMHPRRWAWFASYTDSTGRPLVVPTSGGYNSMASPGNAVAAGLVGSVLGMDVYTDPNLPTNLGAGTNQDVVLMFAREDVWLWESGLRAEALREPFAESLGVLLRVYGYAAMIPDRYVSGLGQISGTGLVVPVFAS